MSLAQHKLSQYPGGSITSPEWQEICRLVAARAGGRCEECCVPHGALGGRTTSGEFVKALPLGDNGLRLLWPRQGDEAWCRNDTAWRVEDGEAVLLKITRFTCTVVHLDGKLVDHSLNNLRYWCQTCAARQEAHLQKVADLERAGQLPLFAEAR